MAYKFVPKKERCVPNTEIFAFKAYKSETMTFKFAPRANKSTGSHQMPKFLRQQPKRLHIKCKRLKV